jgi:hypothetical protein
VRFRDRATGQEGDSVSFRDQQREDAMRLLGYRPEESETPVKQEPKPPREPVRYTTADGKVYEVRDDGPDVLVSEPKPSTE